MGWWSDVINGGLDPRSADPVDLARRRTIAGTALALFPFGFVLMGMTLVTGDPTDVIATAIGMSLALALLWAQSRPELARALRPEWVPHGFVAALYLAVVLGFGSEPFQDTGWAWINAVPVTATVLTGRRGTWVWTAVSEATLAGLCVPMFRGQLPGMTPVEDFTWWVGAAVLMLALLAPATISAELWRSAQASLIRSVADLQRAVSEREAAERDARRSAAAAEEANAAKGRFLATMSHELRTPLHGVLGSAALLNEAGPEERDRLLGAIDASGQVLLGVIDDILDMSRIEAGFLRLAAEPVLLGVVLDEVAQALRPRLAGRDVAFDVVMDPDLPRWIRGDATRIRQILFNLAGNAVKFTERGRITVAARRVGERVCLEVTDTGSGVAPDDLPRLFEPFVQAESSNARRHGGTGLGLAIVRALATAMGGEVGGTSTIGQGSTFWASLPLVAAEPAAAPTPTPAAGRTLRVLVVDDNAVNRMVARGLLRALGHQSGEAPDGEAALRTLETSPWDVVLLDVHMPGIDGLEVARRVRRLPPPRRAVRLIALTADALPEHREQALQAGMDAHLAKPVGLEALRRALE